MIKVGVVGLGRLGRVHADNIANRIPNVTLTAVCSLQEEDLTYAKKEWDVENTFTSYEEMVDSGTIDAVVIVSPSGFHTSQVQYAMSAGLHVFTEKPLGVDVESIEKTIEIIEKYPEQVFLLGFMRRYDDSYQYAKDLLDSGELGEITLIRCYGIDPSAGMESFVEFAKNADSGGLFLDMAIHDIDLIRWFTDKEPKKVWAIGKNAAYPELDELNELETGAAMMQLEDDVMALLVSGRNAAHGYHVETEIMTTLGMLRIGNAPEKNLVTVYDDNGVVRPTSQDFPERFGSAFVNEMEEFANCILEGRQPDITAYDGLRNTQVAIACQESFDGNKLVEL